MLLIDNVIITIKYDTQEYDMALPCKIAIELLKPVLAEALSRKGINLNNMFRILFNGNPLKDKDTLSDAGVWDGSYLTIN